MDMLSRIQNVTENGVATLYQDIIWRQQALTDEEEQALQEKIQIDSKCGILNYLIDLQKIHPHLPIEHYDYHYRRCQQKGLIFECGSLFRDNNQLEVQQQLLVRYPDLICQMLIHHNIKPHGSLAPLIPFERIRQCDGYQEWVINNQMFREPFLVDILAIQKYGRNVPVDYLYSCNMAYGWNTERTDWYCAALVYQNRETAYWIENVNGRIGRRLGIVVSHATLEAYCEQHGLAVTLKVYQKIRTQQSIGIPFKWKDLFQEDLSNINEELSLHL